MLRHDFYLCCSDDFQAHRINVRASGFVSVFIRVLLVSACVCVCICICIDMHMEMAEAACDCVCVGAGLPSIMYACVLGKKRQSFLPCRRTKRVCGECTEQN